MICWAVAKSTLSRSATKSISLATALGSCHTCKVNNANKALYQHCRSIIYNLKSKQKGLLSAEHGRILSPPHCQAQGVRHTHSNTWGALTANWDTLISGSFLRSKAKRAAMREGSLRRLASRSGFILANLLPTSSTMRCLSHFWGCLRPASCP